MSHSRSQPETNQQANKQVQSFMHVLYAICMKPPPGLLAHLGKRRSTEQKVVSSNPRGTKTQALKITEEKVL